MDHFKQRAIVFIDGANLHNGLKHCYGIKRLDLEPFCRHIVQNHELCRIYYADANFIQSYGPDNYAHQQSYFSYIRKNKNIIFRKGYYRIWDGKPIEKKSDVYIATDIVDLCYRDEFDVAYLVSADADLAPAVDIATKQGKIIINVYFDITRRNSYALRGHCQGRFKNITRTIAERFEWGIKKKPEPFDSGDHKS